jgi:hypothetical protein
MRVSKALWISILVVLALAGVAVADSGPDGGQSSGGETGDVVLTQSIVTEIAWLEFSATIYYPDGWAAAVMDGESGMVIMGTDKALLDDLLEGNGPDELPEHEGFIMVQPFPAEIGGLMGASEDDDLIGSLTAMMEGFATTESEVGEPREIVVDGVTIAFMEISEDEGDGIVMLAQKDDAYIMGIGATSSGKLDTYRDIFVAMMAAVEVK